jgi:hypothetical protein
MVAWLAQNPFMGWRMMVKGGELNLPQVNAFGVNFDWLITSKFGIFGRYSYASTEIDPSTPGRAGGNINSQSFQFGLGFPDFGKQGALATLSFLVPFDVIDGRKFLVAGGGRWWNSIRV